MGPPGYGFGIWYAGLPLTTVVWLANRDSAVGKGSFVMLRMDGNLVVVSSDGVQVWMSNTNMSGVQGASLGDDGNLQLLRDGNNSAAWQSFSNPTHTLLPNQVFGSSSGQLIARKSKYDLSSGRYSLSISASNLVLKYINNGESYWSLKNTSHFRLVDPNGAVELNDGFDNLQYLWPSDISETGLARLSLDEDGNLRTYRWDANSTSWLVVWALVSQVCKVSGLCGPNGICTHFPRLACTCAPGFHVKDSRDWSQGCVRNVPLTCGEASKLVRVERADFYNQDLQYNPNTTQEACTQLCLTDCHCLAAGYKQAWAQCYRKGNGDFNGYLVSGMQGPQAPNTMFLKVSAKDVSAHNFSLDDSPFLTEIGLTCTNFTVPPPAPQQPADESRRESSASRWSLEMGVISAVTLVQLVGFSVAWWFLHRGYTRKKRRSGQLSGGGQGVPIRYTYEELEAATEGFRLTLGSGAFGTVFKGSLLDGTEIAVKRLREEALTYAGGVSEFRAEVSIMGKIRHRNLLRLLGFCVEGDAHKMLVYEFMPNGSLDHLLSLPDVIEETASVLDWAMRLDIAVGTARAIAYLHEECQDLVMHCDIKPPNILLDAHMQPKVADFGLAKLSDRERTVSVSMIRGTRGYLAPEWLDRSKPLTCKADVYSFGVVLLELVSGRKTYVLTSAALESGEWYLVEWAWRLLQEGRLRELVDGRLGLISGAESGEESDGGWGGGAPLQEIERVVKVAFWCLQEDVDVRPSMTKATRMLQGTLPVPPPPSNPAF